MAISARSLLLNPAIRWQGDTTQISRVIHSCLASVENRDLIISLLLCGYEISPLKVHTTEICGIFFFHLLLRDDNKDFFSPHVVCLCNTRRRRRRLAVSVQCRADRSLIKLQISLTISKRMFNRIDIDLYRKNVPLSTASTRRNSSVKWKWSAWRHTGKVGDRDEEIRKRSSFLHLLSSSPKCMLCFQLRVVVTPW